MSCHDWHVKLATGRSFDKLSDEDRIARQNKMNHNICVTINKWVSIVVMHIKSDVTITGLFIKKQHVVLWFSHSISR